jgi:hypothetical protein
VRFRAQFVCTRNYEPEILPILALGATVTTLRFHSLRLGFRSTLAVRSVPESRARSHIRNPELGSKRRLRVGTNPWLQRYRQPPFAGNQQSCVSVSTRIPAVPMRSALMRSDLRATLRHNIVISSSPQAPGCRPRRIRSFSLREVRALRASNHRAKDQAPAPIRLLSLFHVLVPRVCTSPPDPRRT